MGLYRINVRDPEGEPLGAVEVNAKTDDAAIEQARKQFERAEDGDSGFLEGSEYVPEALEPTVLWTVEVVSVENEVVGVREVEATSKTAATNALKELVADDEKVRAVAKRRVHYDSIVPLVNQGGPQPL